LGRNIPTPTKPPGRVLVVVVVVVVVVAQRIIDHSSIYIQLDKLRIILHILALYPAHENKILPKNATFGAIVVVTLAFE